MIAPRPADSPLTLGGSVHIRDTLDMGANLREMENDMRRLCDHASAPLVGSTRCLYKVFTVMPSWSMLTQRLLSARAGG